MWFRVSDAKLRSKLLVIAIVPLAGLLCFAASVTWSRAQVVLEARRLGALIELSVRIGGLLHETQRERGTTSLYISSSGKKLAAALETQRSETDHRLGELRAYVAGAAGDIPSQVAGDLRAADEALERLGAVRSRAAQLQGPVKEFVGYYTTLNEILLRSLGSVLSVTSDARFARTATAYVAFLRAKEDTGLERALVANALSIQSFAPGQFAAIVSLTAEQKALLRLFSELGPEDVVSDYRLRTQEPAFEQVAKVEAGVFAGDFGTEATVWFERMTAKIDSMKGTEDLQARLLLARVDEAKRAAWYALVFSAVLGLGVTVAVLALALMMIRSITVPMGRAVTALQALSEGDLETTLDVDRRDEVGQVAAALNGAVAGIRQALQEVQSSADTVAGAADQLSTASNDLSSGAQQQAAGLEQSAASLEQITATVKLNADNAAQADRLAAVASKAADDGGRVVEQAVQAMSDIGSSSKRVREIIATIDEIAFQINLLSLNAAIEAARAGEQGRGFAVVASEVRALSQRSARASKEIRSLIQESARRVDEGSELVKRSGASLGDILSSIRSLATLVGQIAGASREQAVGIDQVSRTMSEMDRVTQHNAAQTEQMSGTAASLSEQATRLLQLLGRFHFVRTGEGAN